MNFSQRRGLLPKSKPLQLDGMDDDLRTGLWNVFLIYVVEDDLKREWEIGHFDTGSSKYSTFFMLLWVHFFKYQLDTLPEKTPQVVDFLKRWFFHESTSWNQVYDLLEFIVQRKLPMFDVKEFAETCNNWLERESSGYRFIGSQIAPISNEQEVAAVDAAEDWDDGPLSPVSQHVRAAVKLFSDREHPDYRNSIKESISAVESVCKLLGNAPGGGLDKALGILKGKVEVHPAMVKGFLSLYGYTSDADGIRHAMMDENNSDFEDAKYMLVSCSAFVNFLVGKAIKAGLLKTTVPK